MQDNKRQNLSVNERNIVELTLQGESQKDIANKLDIAPSTVYRTLRREHIQDMITSSTQGLMSSLVQKMLQNYEKAQERVSREIDTDAMFDRQVKNALRKFDIPEEVIEQQNFKYG